MDFTIPNEWVEFGDALIKFIDREVAALEHEHRVLLGSERTIYTEEGRYAPAVLELRRTVRKRSAELGFYTAFGAEALGGGGLGAQAGRLLGAECRVMRNDYPDENWPHVTAVRNATDSHPTAAGFVKEATDGH